MNTMLKFVVTCFVDLKFATFTQGFPMFLSESNFKSVWFKSTKPTPT